MNGKMKALDIVNMIWHYNLNRKFPAQAVMLEKFKDLNKLKDDCVRNSKEWFEKKNQSREVVDALFNPVLKYPKEKDVVENILVILIMKEIHL